MEKTFLPSEIVGGRIVLRRHSVELAPLMFRYVDQDRERLRKFLPWVDSTQTVADEIDYIHLTHEWWASGSCFDFGIYRASDELYMGNCGVHTIEWRHHRCEIGYWILGQFEGQGFMAEAVQLLESVLFQMGFNRIEIRCSSQNRRSAKVPKSCGYSLEGTLRQDCIENGEYRDTLIFAKLRSEFREPR